jgi:hypothetical protein
MKSRLSLAAVLIAAGMGSAAKGQDAVPPPYVAPLEPSTMNVILNDKSANAFAGILRASGLTEGDLRDKEFTFLVPRDSTCSGTELAHLQKLTGKDDAKAYVLGHVFKGSLSVVRDDAHDHTRALSVNYFSGEQNIEGHGRVQINEAHPFEVPLLNGGTVLLSLNHGVIHFGTRSVVLDNFSGGRKVDLDHCAVF